MSAIVPIPDSIGVSRHPAWISRVIRRFTRRPYSHVFAVYWDDDWRELMVVEAAYHGGIRVISMRHFREANDVLAIIRPGQPIDEGVRYLGTQWAGVVRFGVRGLLGMAWVLVGRWLSRPWGNPLSAHREAFCSQAIMRALQEAKVPGAHEIDPDTATPGDVVDVLMDAGGEVVFGTLE